MLHRKQRRHAAAPASARHRDASASRKPLPGLRFEGAHARPMLRATIKAAFAAAVICIRIHARR
jgi:hypothetical protein